MSAENSANFSSRSRGADPITIVIESIGEVTQLNELTVVKQPNQDIKGPTSSSRSQVIKIIIDRETSEVIKYE